MATHARVAGQRMADALHDQVNANRAAPRVHPLLTTGYYAGLYLGRHAAGGPDPSALATVAMLLGQTLQPGDTLTVFGHTYRMDA